MTNRDQTIIPAIGSIIAWESQAAGSWRTKIGRVTRLPDPKADMRASAAKYELEILGSYPTFIDAKGKIVIPKNDRKVELIRHRSPKKGIAGINQIRIPQAWEMVLVGEA